VEVAYELKAGKALSFTGSGKILVKEYSGKDESVVSPPHYMKKERVTIRIFPSTCFRVRK